MSEWIEGNNIYILFSYLSGAIVLAGLGIASWKAKKQDEQQLKKLEQQMKQFAERQA